MRRELQRGRDGECRSAEPRVRDSSRGDTRARGQTHVLGLLLLVGIVVVGSVGIVVFGSSLLETQRTVVEAEHAERSMLEFSHDVSTMRVDDRGSSDVSFGALDKGHLELREDGHVRIAHVTDDSTEVIHDEPLGTLAYVSETDEIAYQGGGVWQHGDDGTVSLSSPPVSARDGTVTFPVVRLTGDEFRSDAVDGTVRRSDPSVTVGATEPGSYATGTVRIEVESRYCDGWERDIAETVPGTVREGCSENRTDRVRFDLTVPPWIDDVDSAVAADSVDVAENAPPIDGDVRAGSVTAETVDGDVFEDGYEYPSVDESIAAAIAACDGEFETLADEISDPGRYCTDSIDGTHTFDTTDGDIEVVVRDSVGSPNYQSDLRVTGDNDVTIYADGPLDARGNARIGSASDPSQMRLLFSSDSEVTTARGSPEIAALIYAPDSEVTLQGSPTVEGSIVGEHVEIENVRPGGVSYHERMDDVAFRAGVGPQPHHVGITAYEFRVDD